MTPTTTPQALVIVLIAQSVAWLPWSICPFTDRLAVFRFKLTDEVLGMTQPTSLQSDEMSRAQRYRQLADQNRFMYTRHILRVLLGQYTQRAPATIGITTGHNQKPELTDITDWCMNVSHSGDWILVAINTSNVGVDVEEVNTQFAFPNLLPTSFNEAEQQFIQADADPRLAFYQLWTRKEALVKATAKGLDDDFRTIPSLLGTHVINSHMLGADGHWTVQSFPVCEEYIGAIAYQETAVLPKFYTIDGGFFAHFTS